MSSGLNPGPCASFFLKVNNTGYKLKAIGPDLRGDEVDAVMNCMHSDNEQTAGKFI